MHIYTHTHTHIYKLNHFALYQQHCKSIIPQWKKRNRFLSSGMFSSKRSLMSTVTVKIIQASTTENCTNIGIHKSHRLQAWLDPGTQMIHWYPVSPHPLTDSFIRLSLMETWVQQARILTSAVEKTILAYKSLNQSSHDKLYWGLIG